MEQAWWACRAFVEAWESTEDTVPAEQLIERDGRKVTRVELDLLQCYAIEIAEEAKKSAVMPELAPKPQAKLLELGLPKRAAPRPPPVQFNGSDAAMAAVAAASARDDAEGKSRRLPGSRLSRDIDGRAAQEHSVSVPKRAKKSTTVAQPVSGPQPIDARAIAPAKRDAPLPEAGLVNSLRGDEQASPPPWQSWTTSALEVSLPRLGPHTGNQTALLCVSVEAEAERWALNVLPHDHDDSANVYFHFNPRRKERGGGLILNDKFNDNWGAFQRLPLNKLPPLFGLDQAELAFQFEQTDQETTVYVALDRRPVVSWTLRCESPPSGSDIA